MQAFLFAEMNIFALIILTLIFLNNYRSTEKYLTEQMLFMAIIISNGLIIVFDTCMLVLDGKAGMTVRVICLISTTLYYCLNPLICMLWTLYANYQIFKKVERLRKFFFFALIPLFLNVIFSVLSVYNGWMFYFDENNVYHRGKLFVLMFIISYGYLLNSFLLVIKNRKKIDKKNYRALLIFSIPPFVGGILQSLFVGISIIWVCTTISIFIIFINIQNSQLYTDHLTGLYNRRQLDYYLKQKIQNIKSGHLLSGIMIDINSFKNINDIHGHSVGDDALENVSAILQSTFGRNHFIARYGGDEFFVIMETKSKAEVTAAIQQLYENIRKFNLQNKVPYRLDLSIGYDAYDSLSKMSDDTFIKHIDDLMYKDKLETKKL